MRLTKHDVGAPVRFAGFDGRLYDAVLTRLSNGVATLEYPIFRPSGVEVFRAYLLPREWSRVSRPEVANDNR